MEFNADLMAVSVTGSDAPTHVLARLSFADTALRQALDELQTVADHHTYSNDLFYHQSEAARFLRERENDPKLGQPPPLPEDPHEVAYLFEPGECGIPLMWATHPTNYERERNAKRHYVRTQFDTRPAWMLFADVAALRRKVTRRFYKVFFKITRDVRLTDAGQVAAFIDDERAETTYHPRYHGLYDGRLLEPGDVHRLVQTAGCQPWDDARLADAHARLYHDGLNSWLLEHKQRQTECDLLWAVSQGHVKPKGGELKFRGQVYRPKEAKRLWKKVDAELAEDQKRLAELDREVFLVHYRMAERAGATQLACELSDRYLFHLGVQKIFRDLLDQQGAVEGALRFLSGKRQLEADDFAEVLGVFRQAHQKLAEALSAARGLLLPALKNMEAGRELRGFLLEKPLVYELSDDEESVRGKWIDKFLAQTAEVQDKVRRVHFKSLGGILALQEKITATFHQGRQGPATAVPVPAVPAAEGIRPV
jgi:hypothetical protein